MQTYERLMKYAAINTASDPSVKECPSSQGQWELAKLLRQELRELGVNDVTLDENCYLFARIPANIPDTDLVTLGFIAHMDVSPDAPSTNVQPHVVHFDGASVILNEEKKITMSCDDYPVLHQYRGNDLVVSDGMTLLGADDKAGIAAIIGLAERLMQDDTLKHGPVMLGFTPDEEIGRGADLFDVERFGAQFAYTVDGDSIFNVEYETFNAISAEVTINGRSVHPGEAKGILINAMLVAMEFNAALPPRQRPEYTEGYEGFYHLTSMRGDVEQAQLSYILRDHVYDRLTERSARIQDVAAQLNGKYGAGTVTVDVQENYRNMASVITLHPQLLDIPYACLREMGLQPASPPVRGGTDGSRLSFMGLPCPNLGTGSHNHHGRFEFASVQALDQAVELLTKIVQKYAE